MKGTEHDLRGELQDARWALVERIAFSRCFLKAPKLREFLLFVCEGTLHGDPGELTEQEIALRVFNRSQDFDGSSDSIVRVTARELRRKLAAYFETDGASEGVVLTIPKGGYVPVFAPRVSAPTELPEKADGPTGHDPELRSQAPSRHASRNRVLVAACVVVAGLMFVTAGWFAGAFFCLKELPPWERPEARERYAFYHTLLGPIGTDGRDIELVLSNPKVLLYSSSGPVPAGRLKDGSVRLVPPRFAEILAGAENLHEDRNAPPYLAITNQDYTGLGEAVCAFTVGRLAQMLGCSVRLTQGRFLNWASAQKTHLIVLGGPDINNWTYQNKSKTDFSFVPAGIRNESPRHGERPIYETLSDGLTGDLQVDYGFIWMFESLSGSRVLVLAGRSSAATAGIGDFFTDPDKMHVAFERLKATSPKQGFPAIWQVLVKINIREGIPVGSSFVTCRAHLS